MVIQKELKTAVFEACQSLGLKVDADTFLIERPASPEHGDWATNAALILAGQSDAKPRDLARDLAQCLNAASIRHLDRVEVAGPGFLNFHLAHTWLYQVLAEALEQGTADFARHSFGSGESLIVEFVSANPTGPLHAGHARGAVFGDTLARVLQRCGYEAEREFYVNDLGLQVELFGESVKARALGQDPPQDGYFGSYVTEWAGELKSESHLDPYFDYRSWAIQRSLADQKETLSELGIYYDTWFSESSLAEKNLIEPTLARLEDQGLVFESEGAKWIYSSRYGDDKDRVLVKSDGSSTYLLPDIAYHLDKLSRADGAINIWGADHHGYVSRMQAALSGLGENPERLKILICQLAHLERGGEEVRISKRTGDLVLLSDIIKELGADATRFTFLLRSMDSTQVVDLEAAAAQSMENPVYYVQYGHTRIASILRKAQAEGLARSSLDTADFSNLVHQRELHLLRLLSKMPDTVSQTAKELAPHMLTTYLRELAAAFHGFYHDCQIIGEDIDADLRDSRLWLAEAVQVGLAVGLDLCGVSAPEEM